MTERWQQALRDAGLRAGDRAAVLMRDCVDDGGVHCGLAAVSGGPGARALDGGKRHADPHAQDQAQDNP